MKNPRTVRRPSGRTQPRSGSLLARRELWAVLLSLISVVTLITLIFSGQGLIGEGWARTLRQMFGPIGAFLVALGWLAGSVMLIAWDYCEPHLQPRVRSTIGWLLAYLVLLGFIHTAAGPDAEALARAGRGGGYLGWGISSLVTPRFGRAAGLVLMAIVFILALMIATGTGWSEARSLFARLFGYLASGVCALRTKARQLFFPPEAPVAEPPYRIPAQRPAPEPLTSPPPPVKPVAAAKPPKPVRQPAANLRTKATPQGLPSLDILMPDQGMDDDERSARQQAETIEKTFHAFGLPVKVVEWHRGPVVTQFGLEPGFIESQDRDGNTKQVKVRVSKILSLSNDLALALAASPIRMEAPVPGRGVVGIEVPNSAKALVGLRGVLESPQFNDAKPPLRIALGRDVSGQAVVANLAAMPHLLVAGATSSGKSVCLNAIIASLLFFNQPEQVKLLLVDPKRVELTNYNGIPHLIAPVVVDTGKVIVALRWVTREMERRYTEFAKLGVRDIGSYNKLTATKELENMPMIVVIIDELADMMLAAPDDVEQTLCRIAQMARATGIHLVIATQRPSVDVVTGLIKANFPARISFLATSQVDSRVILDAPGAEKLLGSGDMLFMAPDSPKLERIQGCYVFDKELEALVSYWRKVKLQDVLPSEEPPAPWEGMELEQPEGDDALLQQAAELVREHNQASASFLQRQMRIGYPRAARLIDQLQEIGVVGPPEVGGRTRTVIQVDETADDDSEDKDEADEEDDPFGDSDEDAIDLS